MITIDYIKNHQNKEEHISVMKDIFLHFDEMCDKNRIKELDQFVLDFCKEDMCFQYYICVLTAYHWFSNKLTSGELLKEKAIEVGTKEIGKKDALSALSGLLD